MDKIRTPCAIRPLCAHLRARTLARTHTYAHARLRFAMLRTATRRHVKEDCVSRVKKSFQQGVCSTSTTSGWLGLHLCSDCGRRANFVLRSHWPLDIGAHFGYSKFIWELHSILKESFTWISFNLCLSGCALRFCYRFAGGNTVAILKSALIYTIFR